MKRALLLALPLLASHAMAATYYVTVAGLGGEPDYEQRFTAAANDLDKIFKASSLTAHVYTLTGPQATAVQLRTTIGTIAQAAKPDDDFVLILIGHGTFDGSEYKFNLPGPDLTAAEMATLCDRVPARRQLVVDTSSASGGAVQAFERTGRAVIAATKSGTEKNATVFARYWVQALQDPAADTDKNDSVSALEAFTYATKKTAAFYEAQKRLATEHAVFDDTGHGEAGREMGNGRGAMMATFTLIRLGPSQARRQRARQAGPARKKRAARAADRHPQVRQGRHGPRRLSQAAHRCTA